MSMVMLDRLRHSLARMPSVVSIRNRQIRYRVRAVALACLR
jgi:hypothetical protein